MQWLSYICTCEIQKTSFETNKAICYVLDDSHTVSCIVSPCTRKSYVLCFYEELQQKLLWVLCTECHTSHSLLNRVFLIIHCVCWLTTTVYVLFMGSQIKLGVLFWNVVFRHCRDIGSGCFASTLQRANDLKINVFLYFTLCACVCLLHSVNQKLYCDLITKWGFSTVK